MMSRINEIHDKILSDDEHYHIPLPLLTDSYKLTHSFLYPPMKEAMAYGECRTSFNKDLEDSRIVFYGLDYILEKYINRKWTIDDLLETERFCQSHNAGKTPFPWPKDLFTKIVNDCNGYFPVKIEAISEGSVIYPHTPVFMITAKDHFSPLVTFLETILDMVWYPLTVATLSRRCRDVIEESFEKTVDDEDFWLLESRLHDFGFRGCATVEQAMIGGSAHLLNFTGSDTLAASYYVQKYLNQNIPIAESIPATEHSIMTCFNDEKEAILKVIEKFGTSIFACVMDSYDYSAALGDVLPSIADEKCKKGGWMVLRPDSGVPVDVVLMALRAAEKTFGTRINKKGYKVINGASVIQGDGISYEQIKLILQAVENEGFSAQTVAFGMGANLLQRVHRDVCSFAIKLSHVTYESCIDRDIMKTPKTDHGKFSLPGQFYLSSNDDSSPILVYPKEWIKGNGNSATRIVYDHGPVRVKEDFQTIRNRLNTQWKKFPKHFDPIHDSLKKKIDETKANHNQSYQYS